MMADMTEEVVEEIAEAIPDFVESLTRIKVQFGLLGLAIGAAAGATTAWYIAYRKAEMKYSVIADEEIAMMREHYHAKGVALEAQQGKGDLEEIVKERGYSSEEPKMSASPPMAVQPPKSVTASEDEAAGEPDDSAMGEDDVEGPEGVKIPPEVRNVFRDREKLITHEWDEHRERSRRQPDRPYVIHYDERYDMAGYSDISLTYYSDDVLCDERDEIMDPERRDDTVGEANLDRFGHGSNDADIVFIRNDNLGIVYEIIRSPSTYAQDVHGFSHEAWDRGNLERMRSRESDDDT